MSKNILNKNKIRLSFASFIDRTKLSCIGIIRVMMKPLYLLLAVGVIVIFGLIMAIFLDGTTDWNLLTSSLPLQEKADVLARVVRRFMQNATTLSGSLLALAVLLQGITISSLVFNIRKERATNKKYGDSMKRLNQSAFATIFTTLGLGCSTCGTSLLLPVISVVSSSAVFIGTVTTLITTIAIALLLFSLWKLGYSAYAHTSMERDDSNMNKEVNNG